MLFGYFIVVPISVNFLGNYQVDPSILNEFDITSYVSILITLVLACGLLFQLPIVVYFLSKAGIITPTLLVNYRRHAIVVILIISALVTPPDPVTQLLVSFPLLLLYQVSIAISKVVFAQKVTSRGGRELVVAVERGVKQVSDETSNALALVVHNYPFCSFAGGQR